MYGKFKEFLTKELADIQAAGLYKNERVITTPQKQTLRLMPAKTSLISVRITIWGYRTISG